MSTREASGDSADEFGALYAQDATAYSLTLQLGAALDAAEGLREMVEIAEQHAERVDSMSAGDLAAQTTTAADLPPELRASLDGIMGEIEREQAEAAAALDTAEVDLAVIAQDPIAAVMKLLKPETVPQAAHRLVEFAQQLAADPAASAYIHAYFKAAARRPRRPRFFPAILSAVCSEAEQIIASVLRRHLFDEGGWPSLLDPTLDDEVHRLLGTGGALDRWRKQLEMRGVPIRDLVMDWARLDEVFARRNLFLHRRGRVDEKYANRAPAPAPTIGAVIELDAPYLRDAIDRAELLTVGTAIGLLLARTPQATEKFTQAASDLAYAANTAGALLRAEGYSHLAAAITGDPEERGRHRVDAWLAREARLGSDAVRAEVEAWDTTELPREFHLARLILLRQDEAGLVLFEELVADGTLTPEHVQYWPLFARWRTQRTI